MSFDINAVLALSGPKNLKTVVGKIKKELTNVSMQINVKIPKTAANNINRLVGAIKGVNAPATEAQKSLSSMVESANNLTKSSNRTAATQAKVQSSVKKTTKSFKKAKNEIKEVTSTVEEFGREAAQSIKRFGAFTVATAGIFTFIGAIKKGISQSVSFQRELVRIDQITGGSTESIKSLEASVRNLSLNLGINRLELLQTTKTISQAGKRGQELKDILDAVSRSTLAPTFGDISSTTQGLIAALNQFNIAASKSEVVLGSINKVSKEFAVDAGEIISAIRKAGGVFSASAAQFSSPVESLQELEAIFTSVISTTRESADTVATGLRTIFSRIQRPRTLEFLKQLNVELLESGKFVGTFEAFKRISEATEGLFAKGDTLAIAKLVEELGGIRQVGKLIPALRNFDSVSTKALESAKRGAKEGLGEDVAKAVETLEVRLNKLSASFGDLIQKFTDSSSFQSMANSLLNLAEVSIKLASSLEPLLPLLSTLATIKLAGLATGFARGFGSFLSTPGASVSGRKGFNTGGRVGGTGSGDVVPAMLTPGEFVIKKDSASKIGQSRLQQLNNTGRAKFNKGGLVGGRVGYADGGEVTEFEKLEKAESNLTKAISKLTKSLDKSNKSEFGGENSPKSVAIANKRSALITEAQGVKKRKNEIQFQTKAPERIREFDGAIGKVTGSLGALLLGFNAFDLTSIQGLAGAFFVLGPSITTLVDGLKGLGVTLPESFQGFTNDAKKAFFKDMKDTGSAIKGAATKIFGGISKGVGTVGGKLGFAGGGKGKGAGGGLSSVFTGANIGKAFAKVATVTAVSSILNPIVDSAEQYFLGAKEELAKGVTGRKGASELGAGAAGGLSGAIKGGAAGAALFGPVGAAIGGLLGGLSGSLNAAAEQATFNAFSNLTTSTSSVVKALGSFNSSLESSVQVLQFINSGSSKVSSNFSATAKAATRQADDSRFFGINSIINRTEEFAGRNIGESKASQAKGIEIASQGISPELLAGLGQAIDKTSKATLNALDPKQFSAFNAALSNSIADISSPFAKGQVTFSNFIGALDGAGNAGKGLAKELKTLIGNQSSQSLSKGLGERIQAVGSDSNEGKALGSAFNRIVGKLGGDLSKGFKETDESGRTLIRGLVDKENIDAKSKATILGLIKDIEDENNAKIKAAASARILADAEVLRKKNMDLLATALDKLNSTSSRLVTDLGNSLSNLQSNISFSSGGDFTQKKTVNPFDNILAASQKEIGSAVGKFQQFGQSAGGAKGAKAFGDFGAISTLQSKIPQLLENVVRTGGLTNQSSRGEVQDAILKELKAQTGVSADALPPAITSGLDATLTKIFGNREDSTTLNQTGKQLENVIINDGVLKDFFGGISEQFTDASKQLFNSLNKIGDVSLQGAKAIAGLASASDNAQLELQGLKNKNFDILAQISGKKGLTARESLNNSAVSIGAFGGAALGSGGRGDLIQQRQTLQTQREQLRSSGSTDVSAIAKNIKALDNVNKTLKLVASNTTVLSEALKKASDERQTQGNIRSGIATLASGVLDSIKNGGVATAGLTETVSKRQSFSDALSGRQLNQEEAVKFLQTAGDKNGLTAGLRKLASQQLESGKASGKFSKDATIEDVIAQRANQVANSLVQSFDPSKASGNTKTGILQLQEEAVALQESKKSENEAIASAKQFSEFQIKAQEAFSKSLLDGGKQFDNSIMEFQKVINEDLRRAFDGINQFQKLRGNQEGGANAQAPNGQQASNTVLDASDRLEKVAANLANIPDQINGEMNVQMEVLLNGSEVLSQIKPELEQYAMNAVREALKTKVPTLNADGSIKKV